jgi:transposase-like protein
MEVCREVNFRFQLALESEEIRRRTYVGRVFPNPDSCMRLIRALAAEQHEEWQEGSRYLNILLLIEQKRI